MELNYLRQFYEVARHGSFTAASRAIRVSQPSLSKSVRILEQREGVQLLIRSKQGVSLTEEGKLAFQSCRVIFQELDHLTAGLSAQRDEIAGELTLGASDNLCNYILPPLIGGFLGRYPKATVKVFSGTSSQIQSEIFSGFAEIGLFYTKVIRDREFATEPLRFVEFAIVRKAEKSRRPFDLTHMPYIGSRTTDYTRTYPALEMLHSIGVHPRQTIETNSQETQKKLAMLGVGFTLVPIHVVEAELRVGKLMRIPSPKLLGAWLSIVRRRNRPESRVAKLFAEELRRALKKV